MRTTGISYNPSSQVDPENANTKQRSSVDAGRGDAYTSAINESDAPPSSYKGDMVSSLAIEALEKRAVSKRLKNDRLDPQKI